MADGDVVCSLPFRELKIPYPSKGVGVQFPPPAPSCKRLRGWLTSPSTRRTRKSCFFCATSRVVGPRQRDHLPRFDRSRRAEHHQLADAIGEIGFADDVVAVED